MRRIVKLSPTDETDFCVSAYLNGGPREVIAVLDLLHGMGDGEDQPHPVELWPATADVYWDGAHVLVCEPAYKQFELWRPESVQEALDAFRAWTDKTHRPAKIHAAA